jgi:hypothetical protein
MAAWTFMTLVGNGKRVYVDQVRSTDFRSALKAWSASVDIDGMTEESKSKMASWEPPHDAVSEYVWHWDTGIWVFGCDFEIDEYARGSGMNAPTVWVIKTDISPDSQGELF